MNGVFLSQRPLNSPFVLYSMEVVKSPLLLDEPIVKLSPKIMEILGPGKKEFIEEFHEWSMDFFGAKDKVIHSAELNKIFCSPRGYEKLLGELGDKI